MPQAENDQHDAGNGNDHRKDVCTTLRLLIIF